MIGFDLFSMAREEQTEIWPDNLLVFQAFQLVATQWNIGMSGPTGLNYVPLFRVMDELGVKGDDWLNLLHDIKVMESEALAAMHEKD